MFCAINCSMLNENQVLARTPLSMLCQVIWIACLLLFSTRIGSAFHKSCDVKLCFHRILSVSLSFRKMCSLSFHEETGIFLFQTRCNSDWLQTISWPQTIIRFICFRMHSSERKTNQWTVKRSYLEIISKFRKSFIQPIWITKNHS